MQDEMRTGLEGAVHMNQEEPDDELHEFDSEEEIELDDMDTAEAEAMSKQKEDSSCEGHAVFTDTRGESLMSIGSRHHDAGRCKPCAFFHAKGCISGSQCLFCHMCPAHEKQRRKRLRRQICHDLLASYDKQAHERLMKQHGGNGGGLARQPSGRLHGGHSRQPSGSSVGGAPGHGGHSRQHSGASMIAGHSRQHSGASVAKGGHSRQPSGASAATCSTATGPPRPSHSRQWSISSAPESVVGNSPSTTGGSGSSGGHFSTPSSQAMSPPPGVHSPPPSVLQPMSPPPGVLHPLVLLSPAASHQPPAMMQQQQCMDAYWGGERATTEPADRGSVTTEMAAEQQSTTPPAGVFQQQCAQQYRSAAGTGAAVPMPEGSWESAAAPTPAAVLKDGIAAAGFVTCNGMQYALVPVAPQPYPTGNGLCYGLQPPQLQQQHQQQQQAQVPIVSQTPMPSQCCPPQNLSAGTAPQPSRPTMAPPPGRWLVPAGRQQQPQHGGGNAAFHSGSSMSLPVGGPASWQQP